jgi:hypothetical protein
MGAHYYGGTVPSRGQRLQSKIVKAGRPIAVERLDALLSARHRSAGRHQSVARTAPLSGASFQTRPWRASTLTC